MILGPFGPPDVVQKEKGIKGDNATRCSFVLCVRDSPKIAEWKKEKDKGRKKLFSSLFTTLEKKKKESCRKAAFFRRSLSVFWPSLSDN